MRKYASRSGFRVAVLLCILVIGKARYEFMFLIHVKSENNH